MRIYLAGGMRPREVTILCSDTGASCTYVCWQDAVTALMGPIHEFFDPRDSNTKVFEDYSFLDLMAIRQCDLVIAYLESENPSGFGLAGEIAFAKGLGKTVLLVNEQHENRYVRFIENFSDRTFLTLQDAAPTIAKIR